MADILVSPGVYTQEIDESFIPSAAQAGVGAALVGLATKGPAYRPVTVRSFGEFKEIFGGLNEKFYSTYAARSYLRHSDSLTFVRVAGRGTVQAGTVGAIAFPATDTAVTGALSSTNTVLAVVRRRSGNNNIMLSGSPTNFSLSSEGGIVTGLSLSDSDGGYIKKVLGTDPTTSYSGEQHTDLYVDAVFDYDVDNFVGTVDEGDDTPQYDSISAHGNSLDNITGGFAEPQTPYVVSQNFNGTVYNLMKFYETNHAPASVKVSISEVQTDAAATAYPTFTVMVRTFGDSDQQKQVLETFQNVNLDPTSQQYVGRVIGDRKVTYDMSQTPPELLFDGDYPNNSKYIRVEVVAGGAPPNARPSGFKGVPKPLILDVTRLGQVQFSSLPTKTNQLNVRSEVDSNVYCGIDFSAQGVRDRLKHTVTSASGSSSADDGILMLVTSSDQGGSATLTNYTIVDAVAGAANFSSTNKTRFTVPMYGGFDGYDPRSDKLVDLNDGTLSGDFEKAIDILANPEEIDFNLIAIPGVHSSEQGGGTTNRLIDMVTARSDAFALIDLANSTATGSGLALSVTNAITEAKKYDTNYAATYYPWIRINDPENGKFLWLPPSVEVLGAYAFNDRVSQPWFAPAGFNRGGLENVLEARRRLTQRQREDLYSDNINPIATFPGQGIVIFGQKTLQKKQSVLDRVNVRRMLLEVRKTIAGFSRLFVFEPNNTSTRSAILAQVNAYLGTVQSANGLTEFRAILDESTTTPDLVDRNIIKGKIFLQPTQAAEIIIFDFNINGSGASFDEI
jgi:hypothetical protein